MRTAIVVVLIASAVLASVGFSDIAGWLSRACQVAFFFTAALSLLLAAIHMLLDRSPT